VNAEARPIVHTGRTIDRDCQIALRMSRAIIRLVCGRNSCEFIVGAALCVPRRDESGFAESDEVN